MFGPIYTPQAGYDPWVFEGLATHYEARLSPGIGPPALAAVHRAVRRRVRGQAHRERRAVGVRPPGVGRSSLSRRLDVHRLPRRAIRRATALETIANQAHALTGWFFTGTFSVGFGVSFGELIDQFNAWAAQKFPVRTRPPTQRTLATIGNDARYARGRDGTEAWISLDVDVPARLTIRDAHGRRRSTTRTSSTCLPRPHARPGRAAAHLRAVDHRRWQRGLADRDRSRRRRTRSRALLRWRRDDGELASCASDLGPGATIDPTGSDLLLRTSTAIVGLAAWDLADRRGAHGRRRWSRARTCSARRSSPDGKRLAANVWDGHAFVIWIIDATTGATLAAHRRRRPPGLRRELHVRWPTDVARRRSTAASRSSSTATRSPTRRTPRSHAREANGTIRFLDREGWEWELDRDRDATAARSKPALRPRDRPDAPPVTTPRPIARQREQSIRMSRTAASIICSIQRRALPTIVVGGRLSDLGLMLGGADRLDLQRWSIAGYSQPDVQDIGDHTHYGAAAQIHERDARARSTSSRGASFLDWAENAAMSSNPSPNRPRSSRNSAPVTASLLIYRTWRQTFTLASAACYSDESRGNRVENLPSERVTSAGRRSMPWVSAETTRYTGLRRALIVSGTSAYYPQQLSTFMGDIRDLGGSSASCSRCRSADATRSRPSLAVDALIAQEDTGLLQVGGDSALGAPCGTARRSRRAARRSTRPVSANCGSSNRCADTRTSRSRPTRAELGEVSVEVSDHHRSRNRCIVVPAGDLSASVRSRAFGAGAIDKANDKHYDVGGALTLHMRVPAHSADRPVSDRATPRR